MAQMIAKNFDTPTHALSLARLRANYTTFVEIFTNSNLDMQILYSVKTNYMPVILERLKELGCGVDVVSGPEMKLALKIGFAGNQMAFNGPYKTDEELETAVINNIQINIDSIDEGNRLNVSDMRFFCEPGRALISDAMAMIARVIEIKRSGGLTWLMLDAGLNLFPTIAMAERHLIIPLDQPIDQPTQIYRVAGPLCYEGDILAETCALPTSMAVGDLISIEDSGAYTVSRSTNFIRPRAAVVTIDTGHPELCWRREEFDDIFRFHVPLSNRSSQYNP